jgi:hypothetical protein
MTDEWCICDCERASWVMMSQIYAQGVIFVTLGKSQEDLSRAGGAVSKMLA